MCFASILSKWYKMIPLLLNKTAPQLQLLPISKFDQTRGVFNNASARIAIECFLPERKRSPRCLQALAIQVDRCIARKSKIVTKTIMGFREVLCTQYFQIQLSE